MHFTIIKAYVHRCKNDQAHVCGDISEDMYNSLSDNIDDFKNNSNDDNPISIV